MIVSHESLDVQFERVSKVPAVEFDPLLNDGENAYYLVTLEGANGNEVTSYASPVDYQMIDGAAAIWVDDQISRFEPHIPVRVPMCTPHRLYGRATMLAVVSPYDAWEFSTPNLRNNGIM